MNIGQRLLELRKKEQLSQEEVAERLNVTRQTISKWETDQSTPDFDKIVPLCELYGITADELLTGKVPEALEVCASDNKDNFGTKQKRAKGIGQGVLLYFVAIVWIMIAIPVIQLNPIVASAIFLVICGIATYYIIYTCMVYRKGQIEKVKTETKFFKQIKTIIYLIALIIYMVVSFSTMAFHITWIIWVVAAIVEEIVKLIFMLKGEAYEE